MKKLTPVVATLAVVVAAVAVAAMPGVAPAQGEAAPGGMDCSRWPASVPDGPSGSCVCPSGMWWNLRGDACLPREHAAHEFCTTVWPGSDPYFTSGGGYRCVCAPPLLWNADATACRAPMATGQEDCEREWPGTLPVLAPSGLEFECRCPGGRRWDEASRSCVAGAPMVPVARGYFPQEESGPGTLPVAPPPSAGPPPAPASPSGPGAVQGHGGPPPAIPRVPEAPSAQCQEALARIRAAAQSGNGAEADALGMQAAIAGCDPTAISEASRTKPAGR